MKLFIIALVGVLMSYGAIMTALPSVTEVPKCKGKINIVSSENPLIAGGDFRAVGYVNFKKNCLNPIIFCRLHIEGLYDSDWKRGSTNLSPTFLAPAGGNIKIVFQWVCIGCWTYGYKEKSIEVK